jgi:hypothetical protein
LRLILLHIRNQLRDVLVINRLDDGRFAKIPLSLPGFGSQDVAGKGMTSLDLAASRFFETLCSTLVGLDLRHSALLR